MTLALIIHPLCIINQKRVLFMALWQRLQIQVSILLAWPESGWWGSECTARLPNTASHTLVLKNTPCTADSPNTRTDSSRLLSASFFSMVEKTTITGTSVKKKKKKKVRQASDGHDNQMLISTSNQLFATLKSNVSNRFWVVFNFLILIWVRTYGWRPHSGGEQSTGWP